MYLKRKVYDKLAAWKEQSRLTLEVSGSWNVLKKRGSGNQAATGRRALEDGKVDCLLLLKENTQGGIAEPIYTIPVYLFPKFRFDL